jgi:hypothetical protein
MECGKEGRGTETYDTISEEARGNTLVKSAIFPAEEYLRYYVKI